MIYKKYEIIKQIEGFKDVNTIVKLNQDNLILVGGLYKDNNYSMILYEFEANNNSLILKKEKNQIHNSYIYNNVVLDNNFISCSDDGIKFWNLSK